MNYLLVQINIMLDRMHDVHRKCLSFVQLERNDFKYMKTKNIYFCYVFHHILLYKVFFFFLSVTLLP